MAAPADRMIATPQNATLHSGGSVRAKSANSPPIHGDVDGDEAGHCRGCRARGICLKGLLLRASRSLAVRVMGATGLVLSFCSVRAPCVAHLINTRRPLEQTMGARGLASTLEDSITQILKLKNGKGYRTWYSRSYSTCHRACDLILH